MSREPTPDQLVQLACAREAAAMEAFASLPAAFVGADDLVRVLLLVMQQHSTDRPDSAAPAEKVKEFVRAHKRPLRSFAEFIALHNQCLDWYEKKQAESPYGKRPIVANQPRPVIDRRQSSGFGEAARGRLSVRGKEFRRSLEMRGDEDAPVFVECNGDEDELGDEFLAAGGENSSLVKPGRKIRFEQAPASRTSQVFDYVEASAKSRALTHRASFRASSSRLSEEDEDGAWESATCDGAVRVSDGDGAPAPAPAPASEPPPAITHRMSEEDAKKEWKPTKFR
jgi:hypothetical protein